MAAKKTTNKTAKKTTKRVRPAAAVLDKGEPKVRFRGTRITISGEDVVDKARRAAKLYRAKPGKKVVPAKLTFHVKAAGTEPDDSDMVVDVRC